MSGRSKNQQKSHPGRQHQSKRQASLHIFASTVIRQHKIKTLRREREVEDPSNGQRPGRGVPPGDSCIRETQGDEASSSGTRTQRLNSRGRDAWRRSSDTEEASAISARGPRSGHTPDARGPTQGDGEHKVCSASNRSKMKLTEEEDVWEAPSYLETAHF